MARLRLNQGVAAVFYLPHFVAQELGAFRDEGLVVEFVTSFYGVQWGVLERGEADLTIGGPMRTMWLQAREGKRLVSFCAAVRANPWFLVGRRPELDFSWSDLDGRTVIDFTDAPTPALCFRWVLRQNGIDPDRVRLVSGLGTVGEVAAFRAGHADYLMHSLHTAMPLVAAGEAALVQELAGPTGPVPWSTYATLPELLRTRGAELAAFTRAITRALRWVSRRPAGEVAILVTRHFPELDRPVLADAIHRYQLLGIWPRDPLVPRVDFEHFRDILLATGWIARAVPYEDQVDTNPAIRGTLALGAEAD